MHSVLKFVPGDVSSPQAHTCDWNGNTNFLRISFKCSVHGTTQSIAHSGRWYTTHIPYNCSKLHWYWSVIECILLEEKFMFPSISQNPLKKNHMWNMNHILQWLVKFGLCRSTIMALCKQSNVPFWLHLTSLCRNSPKNSYLGHKLHSLQLTLSFIAIGR
jgi:hypothetical protein